MLVCPGTVVLNVICEGIDPAAAPLVVITGVDTVVGARPVTEGPGAVGGKPGVVWVPDVDIEAENTSYRLSILLDRHKNYFS